MDSEIIILNEVSQAEKDKYMILLTCETKKIKCMNEYNKTETDSQINRTN